MDAKLANDACKALIEDAKRLTRAERPQAFARHSKLVTGLHDAAKRALSNQPRFRPRVGLAHDPHGSDG